MWGQGLSSPSLRADTRLMPAAEALGGHPWRLFGIRTRRRGGVCPLTTNPAQLSEDSVQAWGRQRLFRWVSSFGDVQGWWWRRLWRRTREFRASLRVGALENDLGKGGVLGR